MAMVRNADYEEMAKVFQGLLAGIVGCLRTFTCAAAFLRRITICGSKFNL